MLVRRRKRSSSELYLLNNHSKQLMGGRRLPEWHEGLMGCNSCEAGESESGALAEQKSAPLVAKAKLLSCSCFTYVRPAYQERRAGVGGRRGRSPCERGPPG